jgi:hypothetical protein
MGLEALAIAVASVLASGALKTFGEEAGTAAWAWLHGRLGGSGHSSRATSRTEAQATSDDCYRPQRRALMTLTDRAATSLQAGGQSGAKKISRTSRAA